MHKKCFGSYLAFGIEVWPRYFVDILSLKVSGEANVCSTLTTANQSCSKKLSKSRSINCEKIDERLTFNTKKNQMCRTFLTNSYNPSLINFDLLSCYF